MDNLQPFVDLLKSKRYNGQIRLLNQTFITRRGLALGKTTDPPPQGRNAKRKELMGL